jgi:hypothetical protein
MQTKQKPFRVFAIRAFRVVAACFASAGGCCARPAHRTSRPSITQKRVVGGAFLCECNGLKRNLFCRNEGFRNRVAPSRWQTLAGRSPPPPFAMRFNLHPHVHRAAQQLPSSCPVAAVARNTNNCIPLVYTLVKADAPSLRTWLRSGGR